MDTRLSAFNGTKNINSADGAQTGLSFFAFIPDQNTVITLLTGTDYFNNTKDFLVSMGLTAKTLTIGSYYAVAFGEKITAITLSSGAVVIRNTVA